MHIPRHLHSHRGDAHPQPRQAGRLPAAHRRREGQHHLSHTAVVSGQVFRGQGEGRGVEVPGAQWQRENGCE